MNAPLAGSVLALVARPARTPAGRRAEGEIHQLADVVLDDTLEDAVAHLPPVRRTRRCAHYHCDRAGTTSVRPREPGARRRILYACDRHVAAFGGAS